MKNKGGKKRRLKYIGMPRILLATTKTFEVGFSEEEGQQQGTLGLLPLCS